MRRRNVRPVPSERNDDRGCAKRDADKAVHFFDRLIARGLGRREATDLTVAYLLGRMAGTEESEREEWERGGEVVSARARWWLGVITCVFVLVGVACTVRDWRACHGSGGRLVRGMFWWECVR